MFPQISGMLPFGVPFPQIGGGLAFHFSRSITSPIVNAGQQTSFPLIASAGEMIPPFTF